MKKMILPQKRDKNELKNASILAKVIKIAEKNGFKEHLSFLPLFLSYKNGKNNRKFNKKQFLALIERIWERNKEKIIFSHAFALAFWGSKRRFKNGTTYEQYEKRCLQAGMTKKEALANLESYERACFTILEYKYRLQEMVISSDPIMYLEHCLTNKDYKH